MKTLRFTLAACTAALLLAGMTQAATVTSSFKSGTTWTGFANGVPDLSANDYLNSVATPFTVGTGSASHGAGCALTPAGLAILNDGAGSTVNSQTLIVADGVGQFIRLLIDLKAGDGSTVFVTEFNTYAYVGPDAARDYQRYDLYGSNDTDAPAIDGDPAGNGWILIASVNESGGGVTGRTSGVRIVDINQDYRYLLWHAVTDGSYVRSPQYVELDVVGVTVASDFESGTTWTGFTNGVPNLSASDYLATLATPFTVGTGSEVHGAGAPLTLTGLAVLNDGVGSLVNNQTLLIADGPGGTEKFVRLMITLQSNVFVKEFNSYAQAAVDAGRNFQKYQLYGISSLTTPPVDGDPLTNGWTLIASVDAANFGISGQTSGLRIGNMNRSYSYLLWHAVNGGPTPTSYFKSPHYVELDIVSTSGVPVVSTPLVISNITKTATQVQLKWGSDPGQTYAIQMSPDLLNWTDFVIGIPAGGGHLTSYNIPIGGSTGLPILNNGVGSLSNPQTLIINDSPGGTNFVRLRIDLQGSVFVTDFNSYGLVQGADRAFQLYDLYGSSAVTAPPLNGDPSTNGWSLIANVYEIGFPAAGQVSGVHVAGINASYRHLLWHGVTKPGAGYNVAPQYVEFDVITNVVSGVPSVTVTSEFLDGTTWDIFSAVPNLSSSDYLGTLVNPYPFSVGTGSVVHPQSCPLVNPLSTAAEKVFFRIVNTTTP